MTSIYLNRQNIRIMSRIIAILITVIVLLFIGKDNPGMEEQINNKSILPVFTTRGVSVCDYQRREKESFYNLLRDTRELDSLIQVQSKRITK